MGLFRANDRYEKDERILVIQDPEELVLFRQREALGFDGILCPYEISENHIRQFEDYACRNTANTRPAIAVTIEIDLCAHFRKIMGKNPSVCDMRINSNYPKNKFHHHKPSLLLTAIGIGTLCRPADEKGATYNAPVRHIFMMGSSIWHKAPDNPKQNGPRINFVVG